MIAKYTRRDIKDFKKATETLVKYFKYHLKKHCDLQEIMNTNPQANPINLEKKAEPLWSGMKKFNHETKSMISILH